MTATYPLERLHSDFAARFSIAPAAVRAVFAPYRICPLGAHIDHQLGPVTAMAIDRGVTLVYAPLPRPAVEVASCDFPGEVVQDLREIPSRQPGAWGNYLRGAARALQQRHALPVGLAGLVQGSAPEGGLSSSAAVGVAYLLALADVNGLALTREDFVRLDQYIENQYLGLRNGVLDQAAILFSRRDHLTRIDCETLSRDQWPFPPGGLRYAILIAFSGLRQALITTDYNRRVEECAQAARILLAAAGRPDEQALLSRVTADEFACHRRRLPDALARRAEHFFSEVERVRRGCSAWQAGDLGQFGRLVSESGASSIVNYECGAPPLVDLYRLLIDSPGVYGARFSGAGFRGCCLAFVEANRAESIAARVAASYQQLHPDLADHTQMWICHTADGAAVLERAVEPHA